MRILCVFGHYTQDDPQRGEGCESSQGCEYSRFVPALQRLGHQVEFLDSHAQTNIRDLTELNATLLHTVEQYRPDVIFSALTHYEIWLETWQILKDACIAATVNWATDDSWRYNRFSRFVAPAFHAFTTTHPAAYERYRQEGMSHVMLTQWAAVYSDLHPPLSTRQCIYPVAFIGTARDMRTEWVAALGRRGIPVDCFGRGWPRGAVSPAELIGIIQRSVISLNFSDGAPTWDGLLPSSVNQIKARTFEVPGAGGFLLTEDCEGLERYYQPGREVAVFHNIDELTDQIEYYLAHPQERDEMARAGYERTCREHTYEQRLTAVLDFATSMARRHYATLRGGQEAQAQRSINWDAFERAVNLHNADWKVQACKRALTSAFTVVWGKQRGMRAARSMVYELSWRLAGGRTYSAGGWPGRMFNEVS